MKTDKKCSICGKVFPLTASARKFCSESCRKEAIKRTKAAYRKRLAQGQKEERGNVNKNMARNPRAFKVESTKEIVAKANKARKRTWYESYRSADYLGRQAMIAKEMGLSYGELRIQLGFYPAETEASIEQIIKRRKAEYEQVKSRGHN